MKKLWIYSFALMLLVGQTFAVHHAVEHHVQTENTMLSEQSASDNNLPEQSGHHSKDCGLCYFAAQAFDTSKNTSTPLFVTTHAEQLLYLQTFVIAAELPSWQSRAPPILA